MVDLVAYPYPTYVPSKVAAGCVAAAVGISLIAWFIQSCQTRFQPRRPSILLLISHLAIFTELIIRAAVKSELQNSKDVFSATISLSAIGQRVIIVGNFAFVMEVYHKKTRLSRGILIGAMLCVLTSGLLLVPANMFSFDSSQMSKSFLFRQLSAAVLCALTIFFYVVWYWSKTFKDMTDQAIILISISSGMCVIVAIFTLIQSASNYYYTRTTSNEGWFYGFHMIPIIFAHFTWSVFHPKRSLKSPCLQTLGTHKNTLTLREQPGEQF